jgi:hypothetical protein
LKFFDTITPEDVDAIAKKRVNRVEGKKTTYVTIGTIILMAAGLLLLRVSIGGAFALLIVGAGVFTWYSSTIGKKQNIYKQTLLRDWEHERLEKQQQTKLQAGEK